MKNLFGVIDVGSNSVRLMVTDGKSLNDKISVTTRLAEGFDKGLLSENSIRRTAEAVAFLNQTAKVRGVKGVYAFATAAVRNAENKNVFLDAVKKLCDLNIEVITGDEEAKLGRLGALGEKDGGLIDVGGASSEITVVKGAKTVYSYSLNVGAVKIKDICGQDRQKAENYIAERIKEYGNVPKSEFTAIGGTATTVAAILQSLKTYDAKMVQSYFVKVDDLSSLADRLYLTSVEDRKKIAGLQPQRAEIIAGGTLLLLRILNTLGVNGYTASERDNLEGYFTDRVINCEKKN